MVTTNLIQSVPSSCYYIEFHLLETNLNVAWINEFGCRLHNTTEKTAALSAHHRCRCFSHHKEERANDQNGGNQTRQVLRLELVAVNDVDVIAWIDIEIELNIFQVPFQRVNTPNVEPNGFLCANK